jgi:hypothetical protein
VRPVLTLCAVTASSLALCGSALAAYIHPFVKTFGSFSSVQGLAVDSATGDLYVYEGGKARILKFSASGEPASFSATGTNAIEGVDFQDNGTAGIAVDNSSGPAKGDIYVATVGNGEPIKEGEERLGGEKIGIYGAAGGKLGELKSEHVVGNTCGVAVDSSGDLYVSAFGRVVKYAPKANPVSDADYVSSMEGLPNVCQMGVDSLGNVFAASWRLGPLRRFDASQFGSSSATGSVVDQEGASVAVDQANDEIYVNDRNRVAQYGAHGEPFEAPVSTFDTGGSGGISVFGIAVSGYNKDVYVTDGSSVSVFGPLGLVATVETGGASNVEPHGMTLSGLVNPEGLPVSECKVEYGPSTAYGHSQPCVQSPAQIGSGSGNVEVQANLTGLTPGTVYHYRFVVMNANGRGEGADKSLALPGPPVVSGESFSELYEVEVNVRAQINPDFRATTYHVEYGTSEAYGQSTPESQSIGSDSNTYHVLVHLAGLTPGTTYHFRFVASNSLGTVAGPDVQFTTFPASSKGESEGLGGPPPTGECVAGECPNPPGTGPPTTTFTTTSPPVSFDVHELTLGEEAKPTPKRLTRAQKLARALKTCRRRHGKARRRCEAKARKRYRPRKASRGR